MWLHVSSRVRERTARTHVHTEDSSVPMCTRMRHSAHSSTQRLTQTLTSTRTYKQQRTAQHKDTPMCTCAHTHTRMMLLLRCVSCPKLAEGVGDPATCLPTTLEAAWLTWHLFCIENLAWPKTSQNVAQHGRLGVRRGWRCVAMTRSSRVEFMMLGERSCRILYIIRWVLYFSVEACGARMCIAM